MAAMKFTEEVMQYALAFLMWNSGKHGHGRAKIEKDWSVYGYRRVPEQIRGDVYDCWLNAIETDRRAELAVQVEKEKLAESQLDIF